MVIKSVSRARHQDQYTCEAENVESNGRPLIHTIKLVVEGWFHNMKLYSRLHSSVQTRDLEFISPGCSPSMTQQTNR